MVKNSTNIRKEIKKNIQDSIFLKRKIFNFHKKIQKSINLVVNTILNDGKILLCGNGGSAADAQHLAAEYLVRLRKNINRKALPAISLAMDTSTLTASGNDLGFKNIFSRNLEGFLLHKGFFEIAFFPGEGVLSSMNYTHNDKDIIEFDLCTS